jgi:CheY-like chemotaxis protein
MATKGAYILVVEDETAVRRNLVRFLTLEGYEVREAANGEQGIEIAMRAPPDLVLCDLLMPGADGFAVLARLRAEPRTAGTPFIFLSANAEPRNTQTGFLLGANEYLTKPVDLDVLAAAVAKRLAEAGAP